MEEKRTQRELTMNLGPISRSDYMSLELQTGYPSPEEIQCGLLTMNSAQYMSFYISSSVSVAQQAYQPNIFVSRTLQPSRSSPLLPLAFFLLFWISCWLLPHAFYAHDRNIIFFLRFLSFRYFIIYSFLPHACKRLYFIFLFYYLFISFRMCTSTSLYLIIY